MRCLNASINTVVFERDLSQSLYIVRTRVVVSTSTVRVHVYVVASPGASEQCAREVAARHGQSTAGLVARHAPSEWHGP